MNNIYLTISLRLAIFLIFHGVRLIDLRQCELKLYITMNGYIVHLVEVKWRSKRFKKNIILKPCHNRSSSLLKMFIQILTSHINSSP